jgi:hypothetical protein
LCLAVIRADQGHKHWITQKWNRILRVIEARLENQGQHVRKLIYCQEPKKPLAMYLSREEEAIYQGERGESMRRMMEILVALGDIYGAERFVPVRSV